MKILFVCLGNICRSPMAEGIFREKARQLGVDVELDSAGTGGWHSGEAPDLRAQEAMRKKGLDISMLRARKFVASDFDRFDRIYVMDGSNHQNVMNLAETDDDRNKVHMMLNETHPGENRSVPDPYFGGDEGFRRVFDMLESAAEMALGDLKRT